VEKIGRHFARGGYLAKNFWGKEHSTSNGTVAAPTPAPVVETEQVAIRTDDKDRPVEAIAGPDAPSPFESLRDLRKNEPGALVEAARQYANRNDFVIDRLTEIEKLGVVIDREKVMRAIKLQRDDEFEGIVKVLPYIDELEARVKQALEWRNETVSLRNELRTIRQERDAARAEARTQQEANKRLAERMSQVRLGAPQVLVGDR
jgi:hypothetical protein